MSVHLDTLLGHRKQAQGIASAIQQLGWDRDVLVAGDFNAWWLDSRVALTDHGFVDIDCSRRSTRITGRLDRMFRRSDDLRPLKCWSAPVNFGSDHVPLIAEIDFRV
jgi:endonuclease/exonuclease/phosphatase family metal-dependent hydrolase